MPPNNKKQTWKPLAIDFNRAETETTTSKDITNDGAAMNSSQRPELAKAEEGAKAESGPSAKASSKEPESNKNPGSSILEASSTSRAGGHVEETQDDKGPYDPVDDDDDIDAEYEDGEFERDHMSRASGRVVGYHKRFNNSQRSQKWTRKVLTPESPLAESCYWVL